MKECNYCGKYRKCREKIFWKHELVDIKLSIWICELCDKADKIQIQKEIKESKLKRKAEQKDWIKLRDKLLKEAGK